MKAKITFLFLQPKSYFGFIFEGLGDKKQVFLQYPLGSPEKEGAVFTICLLNPGRILPSTVYEGFPHKKISCNR